MPSTSGRSRVHAILVVRPDGRAPASLHLKRTLASVAAQSRPVDALTLVVCGDDPLVAEHAARAEPGSVVHAPASTSYAQALRLAAPRIAEHESVWLLAQDTAPEHDTLALLAGTLELSPSIAVAAPKLVRWDDRSEIVSLGVSMTRLGRTVVLAEDELDQGQHDADEDVLGADVRGLLVAGGAWSLLGGIDPALAGADEGLDLGIRARLAGGRVAVVPGARLAVAGDGAAGLPAPIDARRARRIAYAGRTAQLHRRLAYAHPVALPFVWLSLLPLAVIRTIGHLIGKAPALIGPEWGATATAIVRLGAVARSRRQIARTRRATWAQLSALRIRRSDLRRRLDTVDPDAGIRRRGELHFFAGGGAWAVLGALLVSVAVFTPLLAWPVLGGGALLPLSDTVAQLWREAAWGLRASGLDTVGPADPFAALLALLGTLSPARPSTALVVLWVLSLPLAVLGGWMAATRLTERASLRILAGAAWALAPTFLAALQEGRPTAVIAHLLLPWLFYAGSVAHRSWVAAAAASLLLAGVVAAAPSLAPALVVLWLLAIVLSVAGRAGRGVVRLIWVVIPSAALAAPLVWHQLRAGNALGLLADPGLPWMGPQAAPDAAGRFTLATGFPTSDPGGWGTLLPEGAPTWWVPLLLAPLVVLALLAPLTRRWSSGAVLLGVVVLGLATAFGAAGVSLSFAQAQPVPLWPGAGLSLAWLGVVGAATTTLGSGFMVRPGWLRPSAVALVFVTLLAVSVPALTAVHRGQSRLTDGPSTTLPAYVAAEGRSDPDLGTLVITPQNGGGVASHVVWGPSETLNGQATFISTDTAPTEQDARLAALTADLIASSAPGAIDDVVASGISFVLLAPAADPESDRARATRIRAVTSIDQRQQLVPVGETSRGILWRVTAGDGAGDGGSIADRVTLTALQGTTAGWIAGLQLTVFAIAVLLAVPTAAARRASRRQPRVVGFIAREDR